MRRLLLLVFVALGAWACNNQPACPDGSTCTDATVEGGPSYSNFQVSVTGVVLDPGDSNTIVITLDGNAAGGPDLDVTVDGLPQGVTASPLTIFAGSPGGKLTLNAATDATVPQDVDATVKATPKGLAALTAPLHVRVGSVFHVATQSESFVVPQNLSSVVFGVWGAGGGAGGTGGFGGGGGFATAEVQVTGGETLTIVIGSGGNPGTAGAPSAGGAGGGYSAVLRGTDVLVLAGGGGGGGGAGFDLVADAGGVPGLAGGGGGGAPGQNGFGPCGGGGATDAGGGGAGGPGATAGDALDAGIGSPPDDAGGAGGGGFGGFGWFGGGGGGSQDAAAGFGCGGGGGAAYVALGGASVKLLTATGQIPGGNTSVGYADSGAAVGGALDDAGVARPGAAGLVVVAYPK